MPQFYADFYGKPSALNRGHTVREYWMEQTHGRIGMTFTPYGPYRMPRPLYEYGLNEFNQNGATAAERPTGGGCPTGHRCDGNMDRDVDALWARRRRPEHPPASTTSCCASTPATTRRPSGRSSAR